MICKECLNKMKVVESRHAENLATKQLTVVRINVCPNCKTRLTTVEIPVTPESIVSIRELTLAEAAKKFGKSKSAVNEKRTKKLTANTALNNNLKGL